MKTFRKQREMLRTSSALFPSRHCCAGRLSAQPRPPRRTSPQTKLPDGYWSVEKSQPILDRMQEIRLAPDLSRLNEGERKAVDKLLEVGKIFQALYEQQRDANALSSYRSLTALDQRLGSPIATRNLLTLYRLSQGPIATTLENKREAFLPTNMPAGQTVYPAGITRPEVEAFCNGASG